MNWLLPLFAVVAGISNPVQSGANSALMKSIQAPLVAALIVYLIGGICLLICVPFLGFPLRGALSKVSEVPWWAWAGGICNAIFLLASLLITKKLGSATFTTLVTISAIVVSVGLDHFGLLGFATRTATPLRLLGAGFAVVGVLLIAKF